MDQSIKKGVELAEKELQEKEVERIKNIVKTYLEKINEKTKERSKIDSEIKDLKKDLDDLKSGRLDKIEERQALDPVAKGHSLIIIKKIVEHYYPARPWYSQYEIRPVPFIAYTASSGPITTIDSTTWDTQYSRSGGASNAFYSSSALPAQDSSFNAVGVSFQNFVGGTYKLDGGDIVNL